MHTGAVHVYGQHTPSSSSLQAAEEILFRQGLPIPVVAQAYSNGLRHWCLDHFCQIKLDLLAPSMQVTLTALGPTELKCATLQIAMGNCIHKAAGRSDSNYCQHLLD